MNKRSNLKERFEPIIEQAIACSDKRDIKSIRVALAEAYPFESTQDYAYKVWLNEVHRQLGFKLKRSKKHKDQLELFE